MKRINVILSIIIVFGVVLLTAATICSSTATTGGNDRGLSSSKANFKIKDTINYEMDTTTRRIPASKIVNNRINSEISIIFSGNETVYYLQCVFSKDSMVPDTINCYEYDLALCSSKLVYSASDERCCSKDYCYVAEKIFYVICAENNIKIEYYDTNSSERICVATFENNSIPSLSGAGDFITWYVLDGEQLSLYGYQISTGYKFLISDQVIAFNAETVAYVNDNKTAYITRTGEEYVINLYDLEYKEIIQRAKVDKNMMISKIQANTDYIVYTDVIGPEITNCSLNVINLEDGCSHTITIEGRNVEVYDFSLSGNYLSISTYENNKNLLDTWVVYDLDLKNASATEYVVENSFPGIMTDCNNKLLLLDANSGDVIWLR